MKEEQMIEIMKQLVEEKIELVQQNILHHAEYDDYNKHMLMELLHLKDALKVYLKKQGVKKTK